MASREPSILIAESNRFAPQAAAMLEALGPVRFSQLGRGALIDQIAKAFAGRTCAERTVKAEQPWRGRTNIEIAMRAMPTGGEWQLGMPIANYGTFGGDRGGRSR